MACCSSLFTFRHDGTGFRGSAKLSLEGLQSVIQTLTIASPATTTHDQRLAEGCAVDMRFSIC